MWIFLAQGIADRQITINTTVGQAVTWIIIGLVAGVLASFFMRGRTTLGGSLILGLAGALLGGFLLDLLNIELKGDLASTIEIRWADIVTAFVGAVVLLFIVSLIRGRGGRS